MRMENEKSRKRRRGEKQGKSEEISAIAIFGSSMRLWTLSRPCMRQSRLSDLYPPIAFAAGRGPVAWEPGSLAHLGSSINLWSSGPSGSFARPGTAGLAPALHLSCHLPCWTSCSRNWTTAAL
jgi:hypothetical protein